MIIVKNKVKKGFSGYLKLINSFDRGKMSGRIIHIHKVKIFREKKPNETNNNF